MKVLVVDDETIILRLLTRFISQFGYEVFAFSDGEEAWEAYENHGFPIVITDWIRPGMAGFELVRKIRESESGAQTVIIVLTALTKAHHIDEILNAGADDYIKKPLDPDLLNLRLIIAERNANLLRQLSNSEKPKNLIGKSVRRLSSKLRSLGEGVCVVSCDSDPKVLLANDAFLSMLKNDDELARSNNLLLDVLPDQYCSEVMDQIKHVISTGEATNLIISHDGSGERRKISIHISPMRKDKGILFEQLILVQRDISPS